MGGGGGVRIASRSKDPWIKMSTLRIQTEEKIKKKVTSRKSFGKRPPDQQVMPVFVKSILK